MVRLLRIERAISWIGRSLTANRDPFPVPKGYIDAIYPNLDVFGSQQLENVQEARVNGGAGNVEAFHTIVPDESVRFYLSMEYRHDDVVARLIRPGRIIPTATGFPFASFRDDVSTTANVRLAVRNVPIGPRQRIAVRVGPIFGAAAQIFLDVVWIEVPIGEYIRTIS